MEPSKSKQRLPIRFALRMLCHIQLTPAPLCCPSSSNPPKRYTTLSPSITQNVALTGLPFDLARKAKEFEGLENEKSIFFIISVFFFILLLLSDFTIRSYTGAKS